MSWTAEKSNKQKLTPPHPTPPGVGSFMGKNFKCQTFHELSRKSIFFLAPPTPSDGRGRGENFKVTKHQVLKSIPGMQLSCAIITLRIFWTKPGNPREGEKE